MTLRCWIFGHRWILVETIDFDNARLIVYACRRCHKRTVVKLSLS
jgi:hypothetical protein